MSSSVQKNDQESKAIAIIANVKEDERILNMLANALSFSPVPKKLIAALNNEIQRRQIVTPEQIREILVEKAREGKTITYSELGAHFGGWRSSRRALLARIHPVSVKEHVEKRPMIASIVVREDGGRCGNGIFTLAKMLKMKVGDKNTFEDEQRMAVFDYWSTH